MKNKKLRKQNKLTLMIFLIGINFIVCLLIASCSREPRQRQFLLLYEQRMGPPEFAGNIYSVHPDGSNLQLVMELDHEITERYWFSPNGRYLALLNQEPKQDPSSTTPLTRTLIVMDLSSQETIMNIPGVGHTRFKQLPNETSVVWSPQGDKLVFVRNSTDEVGTDIWLYDLDSAKIAPLTDDAVFDLTPVWSPSGEQVAFVTGTVCRGNSEGCSTDKMFWELAIVNVESSNQQTLTNFHDNTFFVSGGWVTLLCNLSWSPNERYIAFENDCANLRAPPTGKEAFVVNTASSSLIKLTNFVNKARESPIGRSFVIRFIGHCQVIHYL
jgi:Tol biopolymer transport system component